MKHVIFGGDGCGVVASAPQGTGTNAPVRALCAWRARAITSLPVPLSPRSNTEASLAATFQVVSSTRANAGLVPLQPSLLNAFLDPIRKKRADFAKNHDYIEEVIRQGAEVATKVASETMEKVRKAMGF